MAALFLQTATSTSGLGTYTFSAQNLGTAASDRYIVVAVASRKAGASATISSVSVGGVTASIVSQVTDNVTNTNVSGLAIAAVPSGTTGDVVVTFSLTMLRCGIALYRLDNLVSSTPYDFHSSTVAAPTASLQTTYGCAIGTAITAQVASTTWTGLVAKDYDLAIVAGTQFSGASTVLTTSGATPTVTATFSNSQESAGNFASWAFNRTGKTGDFFAVM